MALAIRALINRPYQRLFRVVRTGAITPTDLFLRSQRDTMTNREIA
ncbi:hypothetical protein J8J14_10200 [Roseomonas sp. SSH11]|uniref:Uncharacterized protein n=1 Tax=Pararoseomonas baculiformis TaxID=2820812 RepID=A0ABS4AE47_9PROT|nr:hypothetical protein [Pararoseomonas baculiformis]MBP0445151.1 hypothetical protein [Pararoseomonas baculiformis]